MDLLSNPFYLLSASIRDDRHRLMELADEKSLLHDEQECLKARSDLTNPRKRLVAELAWLPGVGPKRSTELLTDLSANPNQIIDLEHLFPIAYSNLISAGMSRLGDISAAETAKWILKLAYTFDRIDIDDVQKIINDERVVSGFSQVTDFSVIESELKERRRYYRKIIKNSLDNLSSSELIVAVTLTVDKATRNGTRHGPSLIEDLVDSYEVEAQAFLDKEEENIDSLVSRIEEALEDDIDDQNLEPMVNNLIKVVRNWDMVAQPIQVSTMSRGLDHDASHRVARNVRNLAISFYNEYDKIHFSQQLTGMLQKVFAEVLEVAEQTAEDADALSDIAEREAFQSKFEDITDLIEEIKSLADQGKSDSLLSQKIEQLSKIINNWDIQYGDEANQYVAWSVRDLAINLFNEHNKLDFSRKLTQSLLTVFSNDKEILERISEDAKALGDIADSRRKITRQFKMFNLNGDTFIYKGTSYDINKISHIEFYRSLTTHRTNFVETGKTEAIQLNLTFDNQRRVKIVVDEQGVFFNKNKSEEINTIAQFYGYLSQVTFEKRLESYEDQINNKGYFNYDDCTFYPNNKIVFRGKEFPIRSSSFLKSYGVIEMRKKNAGFMDKVKREVSLTKIPQFSTSVDTDVIFYILEKHFSLSWKN